MLDRKSMMIIGTHFNRNWTMMIPNGIVTCALYIQILFRSPEQTTYLIFSIYSLVCVVR